MALSNLYEWKQDKKSSPCGAADQPEEKPTPCGSACGAAEQ